GFRKANGYFDQAIAADPNYALAYSGLAQSYARFPIALDVPPKEVSQKASYAASRALAIDDVLAEAHVSLATVKYFLEWDWPGVERECKRGIELDTNNVLAHFWYSHYLSTAGRRSEAIAEAKRALDLDPLSEPASSVRGMSLYHARQYDQAIEVLQNGLETDPNRPFEHGWLGDVFVQKAKYDE